MAFDDAIVDLRERVAPLARFIHTVSGSLPAPKLKRGDNWVGFRYENPEVIHFCVLRAARIVSGLNASIELVRAGFTQEIGVVLRTNIEYVSHIDFVLASRDEQGKLSAKADKFLAEFFSDDERGSGKAKKVKLVQQDVHKLVGERLDKISNAAGDGTVGRKAASDLMSNIYLTFSYYVHGRYPESMDLYGGRPGYFHLNGMSRTPKDVENIQILDSLVTAASNCFKAMTHDLKLHDLVKSDPRLKVWMAEE